MNKLLILVIVLLFFQNALSADLAAIKLDAAKRSSCSISMPCHVNIKGHDGTYVVKVNKATISKEGVLEINSYEYQRFAYDENGSLIQKIDSE